MRRLSAVCAAYAQKKQRGDLPEFALQFDQPGLYFQELDFYFHTYVGSKPRVGIYDDFPAIKHEWAAACRPLGWDFNRILGPTFTFVVNERQGLQLSK